MERSIGCIMAELKPTKVYRCTETCHYISRAAFAKKRIIYKKPTPPGGGGGSGTKLPTQPLVSTAVTSYLDCTTL